MNILEHVFGLQSHEITPVTRRRQYPGHWLLPRAQPTVCRIHSLWHHSIYTAPEAHGHGYSFWMSFQLGKISRTGRRKHYVI